MATPFSGVTYPGEETESQRRAKEAARIQLRSELSRLPTTGLSTARTAQALAPQATQQVAQAGLGAAKAQQELTAAQAQNALATQRREVGTQLASEELGQREDLATQEREQYEALAQEQQDTRRQVTQDDIRAERAVANQGLELDNNVFFLTEQQRRDLAQIDERLVQRTFDQRRVFDRDETGRKFSNEQQLLDWSVVSAKSEQDFKDKAQIIDQEMQRESEMFKYILRDLEQTLKRGYMVKKGDLDGKAQAELIKMKQEYADMLRAKEDEDNARREQMKAVVYGATLVGKIIAGA